jgi:hypothetical protein
VATIVVTPIPPQKRDRLGSAALSAKRFSLFPTKAREDPGFLTLCPMSNVKKGSETKRKNPDKTIVSNPWGTIVFLCQKRIFPLPLYRYHSYLLLWLYKPIRDKEQGHGHDTSTGGIETSDR